MCAQERGRQNICEEQRKIDRKTDRERERERERLCSFREGVFFRPFVSAKRECVLVCLERERFCECVYLFLQRDNVCLCVCVFVCVITGEGETE